MRVKETMYIKEMTPYSDDLRRFLISYGQTEVDFLSGIDPNRIIQKPSGYGYFIDGVVQLTRNPLAEVLFPKPVKKVKGKRVYVIDTLVTHAFVQTLLSPPVAFETQVFLRPNHATRMQYHFSSLCY